MPLPKIKQGQILTHSDKNPLVSVIVPTYSRSEMLLRALNSLNAQTYPNLEIIVVDDNGMGSQQQLATQIKLESLHFRSGVTLRYAIRKENGGGALARNTGIEVANGEFIAFLDDDDEYLPRKIEMQMGTIMEDNKIALVYTHCKAVDDSGRVIFYRYVPKGASLFEQAYYGCIAATSQWLVRRNALLEVGGFSDVPAKQDSIALYKLLLAGYEIRCVPEILSIYHEHNAGRISNGGKALVGERNYDLLIRGSYDRFSLNHRRRIEHAIRYRVGMLLWRSSKQWQAVASMMTSFLLAPAAFTKKLSWQVGHMAKQAIIRRMR